jgi:hypothetical protein
MDRRRIALGCAWIGALFFLITGAWSFLAPHSFFDTLAMWRPYNRHLFHDVGAFNMGIGAALLAGIAGRSGLAVGLWGGTVGATLHAISHWVDADHGGRATDPALLTVFAVVLVVGLIAGEARGR